MASGGAGGDFLTRKNELLRARQGLPALTDVLIVEDESFDAERLTATLRVMFGYELSVRRAATLASAIDRVLERMPEIVFLDDVLKPSDDAARSMPFLRRAGYAGPIIIVSGQVTRTRRAALVEAGADDVIHKDDVDSVRLADALLRTLRPV